MYAEALETYPPLDTLKPAAKDAWIVDGPLVRFGPPVLRMPFSTRMTILRLDGSDLLIHSPTPLPRALRGAVGRLGTPRWIVAPNRLHYSWVADWHAAYPDAEIWLAPRVLEQSRGTMVLPAQELADDTGYPWDASVATLAVTGRFMTEFVFFHRPSRTLVLTDLIENFEPAKVGSRLLHGLTWIGHVRDPDGQTPRDLRATFPRAELSRAAKAMIALDPERVVIAHGRWYERDGKAELERAFRWLLRDG